jgi:hypothetical protein
MTRFLMTVGGNAPAEAAGPGELVVRVVPLERRIMVKLLHRRRTRVKERPPELHLEMPPAPEPRGRRPVTPRDPDANDHHSMWPDLWAGHRTGPHDRP